MDKARALLILGPTASGKTAASLALARKFPCEIISVDSALIYRGMDIGSAKPTAAERSVCPHHLIDIRDINETYSAADFRADALGLIEAIRARGRLPLIVGGTMLYAKALREGIDELPQTDPAVRAEVNDEGRRVGWPAMHERLATVDPVTAARLAPNDSQRIARAIEVYRMTGRALSSLQAGVREPDPGILTYGLVPADRALLHERISLRFDEMVRAGFLDEVRSLMKSPAFDPESPAMRCVGYRQAIAHLTGECGFDEFLERGKAATRQLAKRQMTWLRSMQGVTFFDPFTETPQLFENLKEAARRILG